MRILIIGSEGFIGKSISQYFLTLGHIVFTADIVNLSKSNYLFLKSDISNLPNLFKHKNFDICINASGLANVSNSFDESNQDFVANVFNVHIILEAIKLFNKNCKFINLSSAAVYGNPKSYPISELDYLNPISPYGYHKLMSEVLCCEYNKVFGIHTLSLRIFSVYGPGSRKQLFWDVYKKIENSSNGAIELIGNGDESRDFIFIDDLLEAVNCIVDNSTFDGGAINVASGEETLIKNAIYTFVNLFQPSIKIIFDNKIRNGDPSNWQADITLLKSFGFKHKYSLEFGLNKYVTWLKQH